MKALKAVIAAAGLGTRLLPSTWSIPKVMLPILIEGEGKRLVTKPFVQIVFETLYRVGFRSFLFVLRGEKNPIKDHFQTDLEYVRWLRGHSKEGMALELESFFRKVEDSEISFVSQPEPLGSGNALLYAAPYTVEEPFLVHYGDDLILPVGDYDPTVRAIEIFYEREADVVLTLMRVKDPSHYGVATCERMDGDVYRVLRIDEKPEKPRSNLAIVSRFIFKPKIYGYIEKVGEDEKTGEVMLTSAIQSLIEDGGRAYALVASNVERLEVGSAETYREALKIANGL